MKPSFLSACTLALVLTMANTSSAAVGSDAISASVQADYEQHLGELFVQFHRNPELSTMEFKTAERLAGELKSVGFDVATGIGGTGIIALMENGTGPTIMVRADMDGLPVLEKSGLPYASTVTQTNGAGLEVPVMHACGHDMHMTSLVGTARYMAANKGSWSGTLMLIGQPAEELIGGAKMMMKDGLWGPYPKPDYALALHVSADIPAGKLVAATDAMYSGADTVDIAITGVAAHGASPHSGVDPVVLGSQIVLGLQTLVSRELPPREPGVVTVGSFHAGTKHNIISDSAHLELTVRSEDAKSRQLLLDGIVRIAENMGRVAGLPDDKLPKVIISDDSAPPTLNDRALTERLRSVWQSTLGDDIFEESKRLSMGAEDFGFFTVDPYIPSTYFAVGGTPAEQIEAAKNGGAPVPSHHSGLFKIEPEMSVTLGVEATVIALLELFSE
ncbi:MAG: amidohydrolase [Halieaceae bacterium]|nr:amidohydrolase [Halieaceae bacterium]